jgi:hypothetical protein
MPVGAQIQAMPPSDLGVPAFTPFAPTGSPNDPLLGMPGGAAANEVLYGSPTSCYAGQPHPVGLPVNGQDPWTWQLLPEGLLYKSYLAGPREPRLSTEWIYTTGHGWYWDSTLGGRVGILRYGSTDNAFPEGWQIDVEGAAFPRLDAEHERDLVTSDFRCGVPLTVRRGPWEAKIGYYHISSHLGDEYMLVNPTAERINYVRDSAVLGLGLRAHPDWRLYAEVGFAFYTAGGAEPWEFQFGIEYSPLAPSTIWGVPFAATNTHLRQENDFSGNFVVQLGWQWRGYSGHLFRVGATYFNGMNAHYQFYDEFEEHVGLGLWYDY